MLLEYWARQREQVDFQTQHVVLTGVEGGKSELPSDEEPHPDNEVTGGEHTK